MKNICDVFRNLVPFLQVKKKNKGVFHGKVDLNVKLKILEFLPETHFRTITNPSNISKRVLIYSFMHYEPIMAELAVCTVKQSANRIFS